VLLRRSSGRALTLSDEAFGHNKTQASRNYGEDTLYLFPLLYFALTLGKHRHYCWACWGGGLDDLTLRLHGFSLLLLFFPL
jgi:hypothetical protein